MFKLNKVLEARTSKINGKIDVVKTWGLGTYLQVNGLTQSGGIVENVWKLVIKKLKDKKTKNVLILGLGGGTAAKVIRKYFPEVVITGVEIDPVMIELGEKYLELGRYKVNIILGDAMDFMSGKYKRKSGKYDLILIDIYLGDIVPEKFEDMKFIHNLKSHLTKSGVCVFNRLYYGEKRPQAMRFGEKLEKIFSNVDYIYPEANLMFICHK